MDKINIVLSRSQQPSNICVEGDTEQQHTGVIADKLERLLINDGRFNVLNIPKLNISNSGNLSEAVKQSNSFIAKNGGEGYHLCIHTDGGYEGHGASAFYFSNAGMCFIRPIYEEICKLTPWEDMTLRDWRGLYELHNTTAIAGLIELSFHDKKNEASWIHNNYDKIAESLYKGIMKGVDLMPLPNDIDITLEDAIKICKENEIITDEAFWQSSTEYIKYIDDIFKNTARYIMKNKR
jgi:N-acetylmuramoyl-L-alanine amidase